ncbi:unnamed protein product [Adineta steineri]|uniref:Uncharacterized protein n=1 Tax=Adineta steineri TaxID=433720 RepID=A0A819AJ89_9BILA|nr:unnamed protein product [Adineta steineri]
MMGWRRTASMSSSTNEYSCLKWPLTFASVITTLLAFILLLSFRSDLWFSYELIHSNNNSTISNDGSYSQMVEYGSIGLWTICNSHYDDPNIKCDVWTKETRPHSFNVIIVLLSCALFLSNLTVFPSWGTSILILYNSNNRYIRHIVGFIWILLLLTLLCTIVLLLAMLLTALTPFYSPGKFMINTDRLHFRSDHGLFYAGLATFLACVCLILIITALIWKKMIDMRLNDVEKDLLKQISDDNYKPGWHRIVMAPRTPLTADRIGAPPPYEY